MFTFATSARFKHCTAPSHLAFRAKGIFHIHFPNVIALAKKKKKEEKTGELVVAVIFLSTSL